VSVDVVIDDTPDIAVSDVDAGVEEGTS